MAKVIIQKHWEQEESLKTLKEDFFDDRLSSLMSDFIDSKNYKNYYTNHVVVEVYKNTARLFNKNTEKYIGIGFFNKDE